MFVRYLTYLIISRYTLLILFVYSRLIFLNVVDKVLGNFTWLGSACNGFHDYIGGICGTLIILWIYVLIRAPRVEMVNTLDWDWVTNSQIM